MPAAGRSTILAILALVLVLDAGAAFAADPAGSVHFTLGSKRLDSGWFLGQRPVSAAGDTLAPDDPQQLGLGMEFTWGRANWPVMLAVDLLHTYDDGLERYPRVDLGTLQIPAADVRRRASILELGLGVRRAWDLNGWNPYLGAGGSWVRANAITEINHPDESRFGTLKSTTAGRDAAIGWWAGGGLYRRVGPRFAVGFAARFSAATLSIPGSQVVGESGGYRLAPGTTELDAGGRTFALILGWSFPHR